MEDQLFVGRDQELQALRQHLETSLTGKGSICFVCGQAGTGKTALVRQFLAESLRQRADLIAAFGECNAQTGLSDPYLPFREALAELTAGAEAKVSQGDIGAENLRRVRAAFVRSVQVLVDVAPDLVGLFVPGGKILGELGKAVAKNVGWTRDIEKLIERQNLAASAGGVEQARIFEQYTLFLKALAKEQPMVLVLDDLQWADPASIGLLFYLGRRIEQDRILIIGSYRPDDVALGRSGGRHPLESVLNEFKRYDLCTLIDLDAATAERGRAFVDALLNPAQYAVGAGFRQALYRQTGGHALFTVEILRSLQESGALVRDPQGRWREGSQLDWSKLPARVEGVIEERIDRLPNDERRMLVVASVEGEQFIAEVVASVQQQPPREVVRSLSNDLERQHQLIHADGLRQLDARRLSLFRFGHNLFQQYLYGSLEEAERSYLHEDVGRVLESLFGGHVEEIAGQLGRHFEIAGSVPKAIKYYLDAGRAAQRLSAHEEAYVHLSKGLALLQDLPPDSLERMAFELGLQASLGTTLIVLRGYGVEEVRATFARAREICREMGDPPQVAPVLFGLALFYLVSGQVRRAHEEGEKLLELAQFTGDRAFILGCHMLLGAAHFYRGEYEEARDHCLRAGELYDPEADAPLAVQQGQDPGVTALAFLSWVLWFQGYRDQAVARSEEAMGLAARMGHPYSQGLAVCFASALYEFTREWKQCQARAEEALALAKRGRFPLWEAMATQTMGLSLTKLGQTRAGIAVFQHAVTGWRQTGTRVGFTSVLALLAEVQLEAGNLAEAHAALDEAFDLAQESGQEWWLPEQHRVRGELLARQGDAEGAVAAVERALNLAHEQGARALELRAAISLALLPQPPAGHRAACDRLAAVYAEFAEGLDAPDLVAAREVLSA